MRRRHRTLTTLGALAALLAPGWTGAGDAAAAPGLATAGPPPAQAALAPGIGIGLLEAPVSEENDPRARIYIIDHVAPGTTFSRKFHVDNGTSSPVTLQLYPDAAVIANGSFQPQPGQATNDLTSWIKIDPPQVTLAPETRATAVATFTVPPDATTGEHYGAIMAELPASPGQGITEAARVGIRIYLSVGDGAQPVSDFTITSLTAQRLPDGTPAVTGLVHNTGGRALDLSGSLTLSSGPAGLTAGPYPTANGVTLGIGATQPIVVKLDRRLPDGPWTATMTLRSGPLEHSAGATISFPAAAGTVGSPVQARTQVRHHHVLVPALAALLWLVIVALFILVWLRRRKRDEEEEEAASPPGSRPLRTS